MPRFRLLPYLSRSKKKKKLEKDSKGVCEDTLIDETQMHKVTHAVSEPYNFRKSMVLEDLDGLLQIEFEDEENHGKMQEEQPKSARLRNRLSRRMLSARKNKGKSLPSNLKNDANTIVHMAPWRDLNFRSDPEPEDVEISVETSKGHEDFEGEFERILDFYAPEVNAAV